MDKTRTLNDLLDTYLEINLVRPKTACQYRMVVRLFQEDRGKLTLDEIDTGHLAKWRDQILDRATAITWNNYRTHLRALWRFGLQLEWVTHDPFKLIKRVTPGQVRPRSVPVTRVRKALRLLSTDPEGEQLRPRWFWHTVIHTFYCTGMRVRQLVSLEWDHVDLQQQVITLSALGSKTNREWSVPITPALTEELMALRQRTVLALGRMPRPREQLFNVTLFYDRYLGERMTEGQVQGFFRRLSDRMGEHISCHRLRHTTGTEMVRGPNPDFRSVQQILGHTDIRTTLRYIHPDMKQLLNCVERLPSVV